MYLKVCVCVFIYVFCVCVCMHICKYTYKYLSVSFLQSNVYCASVDNWALLEVAQLGCCRDIEITAHSVASSKNLVKNKIQQFFPIIC